MTAIKFLNWLDKADPDRILAALFVFAIIWTLYIFLDFMRGRV